MLLDERDVSLPRMLFIAEFQRSNPACVLGTDPTHDQLPIHIVNLKHG